MLDNRYGGSLAEPPVRSVGWSEGAYAAAHLTVTRPGLAGVLVQELDEASFSSVDVPANGVAHRLGVAGT